VPLPAEDVRDSFLALLVSLVEADVFDSLSHDDIRDGVHVFGRPTRVPVRSIVGIVRRPSLKPFDQSEITLHFRDELHESVPYSILGYHPGSLRASMRVTVREWRLGNQLIRWGPRRSDVIRLTDVRLFGVTRGWVMMDMDAWIDKLLGSWIDDMRLVGFALYRWNGVWHGMAFGFDPEGHGRSGNLDFRTDRVHFPNPDELMVAARRFRAMALAYVGNPELPPRGEWK
jgi:hypothetical protein